MKPPSWLVIEDKSHWIREGDDVVIEVRLARRFWLHPGFWWALFRERARR